MEEAEVETDVGVVFLLPVKTLVGQSLDIRANGTVVGAVIVIDKGGHGVVGAEALVASEAVGGAQLQPVDPSEALDELLVMDVPSAAYRPERSPAVVVSSFRRTHESIVGIEEVALVIAVVEREQSAAVARHAFRAGGLAVLGILHGKLDVVHEVVWEAFGLHAGLVVAVVLHVELAVDEDEVLADFF